MPSQDKIHKKSISERSKDRLIAIRILITQFSNLPDKDQAWQDLHRLTQDEDNLVRRSAAHALGSTFSQIPEKDQAWQDLVRLTQDEDNLVRRSAAHALGSTFSQIPEKDLPLQNLVRLTQDEDSDVRIEAYKSLASASKFKAEDTADKDIKIRELNAAIVYIEKSHAEIVKSAFTKVPVKGKTLENLHRLTQDRNKSLRLHAAVSLGSAFSQVPDRDQAWQDLHRLTQDRNSSVRREAAVSLGSAFSQVPNKSQAWQDLVSLTQDEESSIREISAYALGSTFSQVPDKDQAWQDLVKLTQNENSFVRMTTSDTLGSAFNQVSDKNQAWQDLHKLTQDEDSSVRRSAAHALGSAFSQVPDKDEAWQDLHRLTQDRNSSVRMYAYHSLGRVSVFKAAETANRDTLKSELNAAVAYFEKSSQEQDFGPAKFCYPFYRTYLAITFQEEKGDEVRMYLAEAREAVGGSESKEELINAVGNLARALQESQSLKERSAQEVASELNTYRWYCEKAAESMAAAEEEAPGVVKLLRKCNPILEDKILERSAEIQERAKRICQITRGSDNEIKTPGAEIYNAAKALSEGDLVSIQRSSSSIVKQLMKFCRLLPKEEKNPVCEAVEEIQLETDFPEKLHLIDRALLNLGSILENHPLPLVDVVILTVLPEEYNAIISKLSNLILPRLGSSPNIYAWRFGDVLCPNHRDSYKVAVGMTGRAGDIQSAMAAKEAISLWKPSYLIFSGIAGGLSNIGSKKGDVIIADCIYGYEYGKIEKEFVPRGNWTCKTDQGLLTGAIAYSTRYNWRDYIKAEPPEECEPEVIRGEIASGEKVVEDPTNEFFAQVISRWPKIKAVEMEGAGIGSAIEQAQSLKVPVGFMVIRAISDLPRPKTKSDKIRGTRERDAWKEYASDAAAAFTVGWIADGLPLPPSARN
ncbi:MAG: HEAT repeat domain-containing protein [Methanothrix sp.]|nr:HEAT repeat domain-containing protein [Methanothrix sp.]MDD4447053.1 HEAT repeat domain-containing protein [Methanothrix sp.]